MIERLTLNAFGKFRKAVFELSGVTVVYGPNEAGKTTFFDGIFQALCRPSETKKPGKILKARYGPGRSAEAKLNNDVAITDEEFLNLYAIREGDLKLELDKGSEWMDKLKSKLFHGGLDPAAFVSEFEKRSSDSRAMVHTKELEKARETSAAARKELERRKQDRSDLAVKEARLAQADAALEETRRLREAAAAEAAAFERDLSGEDRIGQRRKWTAELDRLDEWEALEAEASALSAFMEDRRGEWNRLTAATREAKSASIAEKGKRDHQADMLAREKSEARAVREALESAGPRALLAVRLTEAVRQSPAETSGHGMPAWALAVAVLLCLGGIACIFGLPGAGRFLGAGLGLLLALLAGVAGTRAKRSANTELGARSLSAWKDQAALGGIAGVGGISTLEGFLQAMEKTVRDRDALEAKAADCARRQDAHQQVLDALEVGLRSFQDAEASGHDAEKEWLTACGVPSFEAYLEKTARAGQVRAELVKRRADLAEWAERAELAESPGADGGALQGSLKASLHDAPHDASQGENRSLRSAISKELRRKLRDLDEAGVAQKGLDDAAVQRLRQGRMEAIERREELTRREGGLIAEKARLAGEIGASMGKLAPEIVEWEDKLTEAVRDVKAREMDKLAAALARDIFREIGDGADLMLQGLAADMQTMLGNILPKGRSVSMTGLEDRQIQVQDADGGLRSLDHLSTGTRHAMVLAAKLALAKKHRAGPGVLVLDEPFLAMDGERVTRALELLRDFHDHNGWQIILLTKETDLVEKMRTLFRDLCVIDLSRSGE
ncbi:MAG: AAA family ATPase [Fibrobacteria bacterium]